MAKNLPIFQLFRWNHVSGMYDSLRQLPGIRLVYNQEVYAQQKLIRNLNLPDHTRVLNAGCGPSPFPPFYPQQKRFSFDLSYQMLKQQKQRFNYHKICQAQAPFLPFKPAKFDLIVAIGLSEYVGSLKNLFGCLSPLLHPSAYLIISSSPPKLLNQMRRLLLQTLYLRTDEYIISEAKNHGLLLRATNQTLIQSQFLLQKQQNPPILK